jgi:hypothetical protein
MNRRPRLRLTVLLAAMALLAAPSLAGDLPPTPQHGAATHLGVASCATSTCHGAALPVEGGIVLQNENTTWQTLDKHFTAFTVLSNDRSKRIARNLGLPDASKAKICLDCHADNVPAERRGQQFQLTDGVGCEACHGGAQDWIRIHTINDNETSHARNVAAGLYPTEDPRARAKLCLSCHFGDETKLVTHRLMGAGHPRLSFELDTFTAIEPAHYAVDDDYRERKRVANDVKVWAIGQAMALAQTLDAALNPQRNHRGLFPELVLFDCHACHRLMSQPRWQPRSSARLGPGDIPFNDANLVMLRLVARTVSPQLGEKVASRGRAFVEASDGTEEQWLAAARALREVTLEAADVFEQHEFGEKDMRMLLDSLVSEGARGEYVNYVAAEQTTMAMGDILTAMKAAGWVGDEEYDRVKKQMDEVYAAVAQDEQYRPTAHLAALRRLQAAAR